MLVCTFWAADKYREEDEALKENMHNMSNGSTLHCGIVD